MAHVPLLEAIPYRFRNVPRPPQFPAWAFGHYYGLVMRAMLCPFSVRVGDLAMARAYYSGTAPDLLQLVGPYRAVLIDCDGCVAVGTLDGRTL